MQFRISCFELFFSEDGIFKQSKFRNNSVFEPNVISHFEENVITSNFLVDVLY